MQDLAKFDKSEFDILVAKCGKTIGLKGEIKLIIYSDFLEVFTKGNVFLCKGANSQNLVQNNRARSAHLESRPLRGAKNRIQASSSASADFLLEAEKRGSPPKSEKRSFWRVGGAGRGVQPFCEKEKSEISGSEIAESTFFLTLNSFNLHKNSATFAEITSIDCAKNLTSMLLFSTKSLTQKQCALSENEHFWFEIIGRSVVENGEIIGVVSEIERIGSIDYLIIEVDYAIFAKYPHIKAKRFYLPYISRYILSAENGIVAVQDALLVLESS